jgi:isoleucyl-tRNA synthetase
VWADWARPYVTLDPEYEAAQLRVFGEMVQRGHVYRGRKPVHWCVRGCLSVGCVCGCVRVSV